MKSIVKTLRQSDTRCEEQCQESRVFRETLGPCLEILLIHEGEKMAKMVTDFLGDGVLMYSSAYPHAESRFPESTSQVLLWKSLGDEAMRKMLWDNATKCFGEP